MVCNRGFVGSAKSKGSHRRATKLFVFLICTAGFFYQTWTFLELYLAYPTSQDTIEDYPEEITAPAITICNNNRLSRQRLCHFYAPECNWQRIASWEEFCEKHKRWCNYNGGKWEKIHDFGFGFAWPRLTGGYRWDRSNTILNLLGPQKEEDLIEYCRLRIDGVLVYCNSSIMIQVQKDSLRYRCFSLFSSLGKPNEELLKLSSTDKYIIVLNLHPEEYIHDNDLVQAWVFPHDPRKLVNPMTEGIPLKAGKIYKLLPTLKRKLSLPPPYASKCADYVNEWKENGGYGPLSKTDCIEVCLMKAMVAKSGCVEQEITYPNNFTICGDQRIAAETKMLKTCSSICRDPCEENIYSFTSQGVFDFTRMCHSKDEMCKSKKLWIEIYFNRMTVQKFQHIPRFESIELFSYIGGYLGMWLGIALASLFDFSEMIYDTVYPYLKGRKQQKKTTPIEEFPHQTV